MQFTLKKDFLLGVSSAATQIEGGDTDSNWLEFYRQGGIKDGSSPEKADDHWNRWKEDDDLLISLGIKISRVGIEWGRLVPEEGKVCARAVEHYREEFEYLIRNGVRPLVTIHHFSNPMWFERKGGWVKKENNRYYLELVSLVLENYGDIISEYITINEPNVFATNCYCFGEWYPKHTSFRETFAVMENMAYCHIKAYEMIHEYRESRGWKGTMVGFANHLRVFDPENPKNPLHVAAAKAAEYAFQGALTNAMSLGRFLPPLVNRWGIREGEYSDFNGLNYYSRSTVSGLRDGVRKNSPRNDLGWEIYPEGLLRCGTYLSSVLYRPIWITENGTCDENDAFRSRYIFEHIKAVSESPLPFERYYHWCFIDNWEWAEGESARFGIVRNDYGSQERTLKDSGRFYKEMISRRGVTAEMYGEYVSKQTYRIE